MRLLSAWAPVPFVLPTIKVFWYCINLSFTHVILFSCCVGSISIFNFSQASWTSPLGLATAFPPPWASSDAYSQDTLWRPGGRPHSLKILVLCNKFPHTFLFSIALAQDLLCHRLYLPWALQVAGFPENLYYLFPWTSFLSTVTIYSPISTKSNTENFLSNSSWVIRWGSLHSSR